MNKKCGYKKGQNDSHTKCYNSFVNWGPLGVATCKIYVLSNYNNYIKKVAFTQLYSFELYIYMQA